MKLNPQLIRNKEFLENDYNQQANYRIMADGNSSMQDLAFFLVQNNFCGLGALNQDVKGDKFLSRRLGVRAHIQHLKAYGSEEKINNEIIDRRFKFVNRGSANNVDELTGKWASDPDYARKLKNLLYRLYLRSLVG